MNNVYKILLGILLYCPHLFSQTRNSQQCGIEYYYDNAGNRVQRSVPDCGGNFRMLVVSDTTTTTDSLSAQKLQESLFPNPTSGVFNLVFNNIVTAAQLTITDEMGRQLYTAVVSGISIPVDITSFAGGIYYITVKTEGYKFTSSVVKQ